MRRGIAAVLLSLLVTSGLNAQSGSQTSSRDGITNPDNDPGLYGDVVAKESLRIYLGGSLSLSLVARNDNFFRAALGDTLTGAPSFPLGRSADGQPGTGGDIFIDPQLSLDLEFELKETVSAFVEIATPFNVFNDAGGRDTANGSTLTDRHVLELEQAFVEWENAFTEDLTLRIGIQDYMKDFVGHGNPFFIDVSRSESPFGNPQSDPDPGTPQAPGAGLVGSQEAAGVLGRYQLDNTSIDAFFFTIDETFRRNSDDEMFGAVLEHVSVGSSASNVGATVLVLKNDSGSYLWTTGVGGAVGLMENALQLYGEAYVQFGEYAANQNVGGRVRDIDQDSFALYGGARFTLTDMEAYKPWIDLSYWEISGDDEGDDGNNENFVSLENNNDTVVIEDGYYGLDVDTNYRAIKVKGGFNFEAFQSPWEFQALYAYFELQDNSGRASNTTSSDKLGDEFDLSLTMHATEYLRLGLRTGWLFNAKALGLKDNINVTVVEAAIDF